MSPGPKKELFKFWVESDQLKQFKKIADKDKVSVAFVMRKAFDEYLAKRKTEVK